MKCQNISLPSHLLGYWNVCFLVFFFHHLCNQQPKHNHKSDKEEKSREKLFIHVLWCPRSCCLGDNFYRLLDLLWLKDTECRLKRVTTWRRPSIVNVESCSKNTEGKGPDSKWHLEPPISEAKSLKTLQDKSLSWKGAWFQIQQVRFDATDGTMCGHSHETNSISAVNM